MSEFMTLRLSTLIFISRFFYFWLITYHLPILFSYHRELPGGFQIWLVEYRKQIVTIISCKLRVKILLTALGLVAKRVHSDTVFPVLVHNLDVDNILAYH